MLDLITGLSDLVDSLALLLFAIFLLVMAGPVRRALLTLTLNQSGKRLKRAIRRLEQITAAEASSPKQLERDREP